MFAQIIRNSLIAAALAALAAFAAAPAMAQGFGPQVTRFVDESVDESGDGTSWEEAYKTLQEALAEAASNSSITVINVAEGTYYPGTNRNDYFNLPNHQIALYGGYPTGGGTRDPANNPTILSGDIDGSGENDSYTIIFEWDHDSGGAIVIDGFTFTGGQADGATTPQHEQVGGAIYIAGDGNGDITINDCVFEYNYAEIAGGAVYIQTQASTITITDCLFQYNEAGDGSGGSGGGLKVVDCGTLQIGGDGEGEGCYFNDNQAYQGGAVLIGGTNTVIEYSEFDNNIAEGNGSVGGALDVLACGSNTNWLEVDHCTFDGNIVNDTGSNGYGGAVSIKGYRGNGGYAASFTNSDFLNNRSTLHAAALWLYSEDLENPEGTCYLGSVLIDDCAFDDNLCDYDMDTGQGAAIWAVNIDLTCTDSTFDGNIAEDGGGAIWLKAKILGNGTTFPYFGDAELTLDNCTFRGNKMTSTSAPGGGGGVFLEGMKDGSGNETNLTATITDCRFYDNESDRGGGIYMHSSDEVEISDCEFIGNDGRKAGGGIGIGDPEALGDTLVKICKSRFISNTSKKGGAIHNHEDAETYLVNCILAGNSSTEEGGAVFNSRHTSGTTAIIGLHNCILAGNVADGTGTLDQGGAIFTGLADVNDYDGYAELIHCTLVGNYAGYKYGGGVNAAGHVDSHLIARNCIAWGNSDADGGTGSVDEQLFYTTDTLHEDDVDNNVIDTLDDTRFTLDDEENTDADPVFSEDGSTTLTWDTSSYDPETGLTSFTVDDASPASVGMLFKPDPNNHFMLVIQAVDTGNDVITCWGWWDDLTPNPGIDGALYDLHIDSSGGADDWGDATYIGPRPNGSGDVCDLDGNPTTNTLPYDLDTATPNGRNQNGAPDAGVYEIPN